MLALAAIIVPALQFPQHLSREYQHDWPLGRSIMSFNCEPILVIQTGFWDYALRFHDDLQSVSETWFCSWWV